MGTLLKSIAAAFENIQYPGDDSLTVYDSAGRECDETWQLLRGRRWQEFPIKEFMCGDTSIPDLSPAAFHYYMPALLTAIVNGGDDCGVADSLMFYLSPSSAINTDGPSYTHYDHREDFKERMTLFSPGQREVMIHALEDFARRWNEERHDVEAIEFLRSHA